MAIPVWWRRARQHFSIDAPRMAVRSRLPWPWRAVLVIALVAMIAGMWWWGFDFGQIFGGFNRKEVEARLATLAAENAKLRAALETALKLYKLDSGIYPGTEQGLTALVQKPEAGVIPKKWRQGGYLEKNKVPKDPWGNDYVYLSPGLKGDFDIISYGADGVPGGENENKDINNWDTE